MPGERSRGDAMSAGLEPSRPVFDRATRLARTLFGRVEAQVTLLGESGPWSSRGQVVGSGSEVAAVRHVMRVGELVWIEDCRDDPRFRGDPVVAGPPHVRFFAGAPIRLEDGSTPGALWVAGLEPRAYDRSLARRLQDLADFVADEWIRVKARNAQSNYERTLAAMVEVMPLSLVLLDRQMRVIYASHPWIKARGLEGRQVIGRTIFELRPEVFERWREALARGMTGQSYSVDRLRIEGLDGKPEWLKVEVNPWYDLDGAVGGLILASHDITELMGALELSERSEDRLKLAMQLTDLYVYELDHVREELIKVGAESDFFDRAYSYADLRTDPHEMIDPRDRPAAQEAWTRQQESGGAGRAEFRIRRNDGKEVWVAAATKLILNNHGEPIRLVGAMRDITERKLAEQALVQAKEEAESANRAKSAFLATMSHEIRTPLNGVLGMAQAIAADDDITAVQRERLEVIRQSGQSLLAILNDVLDLSKVEAGKLALEHGRFEVGALAQSAQATFSAIAEAKGLTFDLTIDRAAQGVYEGDQVRVRQILWNLVSNALKFTERGGVSVRVRREKGELAISVLDSGIGLTHSELAGLFRKFEQADASTTRRFGGTGLGLAICRELAGLMGGRISVTSAPGMGSAFTVTLPLKKVARAAAKPMRTRRQPAKSAKPAPAGRPLRILAAEDNPMNQLVLKTLLAQAGIEPEIVANGQEAVDAWAREPWDLILMDVQMPLMDGLAATRLIREREQLEGRTRTPIVALTANAMSHQVAEYRAGGMDAFVAKPIEAGRLYEALQRAVDGPLASAPQQPRPFPVHLESPEPDKKGRSSRG
jgi:PAS domain S-box-containing protein